MKTIERLDEDNKVIETYKSLNEAAASLNSKQEDWQIALNIAYAIINNTWAYKSKWRESK